MSGINSSMPEVSWRELQGNVYNRSLHPAMLTEQGYRTTQKARLIGKSKFDSEYVIVIYDESFIQAWLLTKLVKPLASLELNDILKRVQDAYSSTHLSTAKQSLLPPTNDDQV